MFLTVSPFKEVFFFTQTWGIEANNLELVAHENFLHYRDWNLKLMAILQYNYISVFVDTQYLFMLCKLETM